MKSEYKFLVGGEWRTSDEVSEVRFPYTDELVARVYQATDKDLEDAVVSAQKGFEITRKLPSHKRSKILYALLDQMEKRGEEIIETLIMEGGKARSVAIAEYLRAKETIRTSAEEAKRVGGEVVPIDWTELGENRIGIVRRFPIGIVLCISPFNYPLNLSCHKVGPAMAAGNSFILKPASATPLSGLLLGEMILEAGFPPEAVNVVTCRGSKAEKLVADPRIAFFTFTGSSEVGWYL
ncbi:MAG: aldehyde dehydrogenase family protein, partial [Anaerolineales bacterium]|nr:aldehyde dehydrogenase family protein [Anaerolineales bacterium]MDW8226793.1 aldehyde dehydrogenase family protein [Anaerolineales bacterium]